MGMWRFLDRAIALIDAVACQKVTEDLDSLAGRKNPLGVFALLKMHVERLVGHERTLKSYAALFTVERF
jgi:hypothetical protein